MTSASSAGSDMTPNNNDEPRGETRQCRGADVSPRRLHCLVSSNTHSGMKCRRDSSPECETLATAQAKAKQTATTDGQLAGSVFAIANPTT